jgi:hypothetical protein
MNDGNELSELSKELIGLDNVSLEELETRLELALGHLGPLSDGCSSNGCTCTALQTCVAFCFS